MRPPFQLCFGSSRLQAMHIKLAFCAYVQSLPLFASSRRVQAGTHSDTGVRVRWEPCLHWLEVQKWHLEAIMQ
jgi:hypothetical protein